MLGALFTSPTLIRLALPIMGQIVEFLFSAPEPERNALVRFLVKRFIYDHFALEPTNTK